MRICIDIDGTLCSLREPHQAYSELEPFTDVADKIKHLKDQGCYIILSATQEEEIFKPTNTYQTKAKQGAVLQEWLDTNGFVYDEIWIGKPDAQVYINDKLLKFGGSWEGLEEKYLKNYL